MSDPALVAALAALRARRTDLDEAIRALERVVAGDTPAEAKPERIIPQLPNPALFTRLPSRRGAQQEAVMEILTGEKGVPVTPEDLAGALERRGLPIRSDNPVRAARAAGNRAREKNPQIQLEDGAFVYRPHDASEDENGSP